MRRLSATAASSRRPNGATAAATLAAATGCCAPNARAAPEPVGVPAPEIVQDGQPVLATLLDRPVVDSGAGVVGRGWRRAGEGAEHQIRLRGAEPDTRPRSPPRWPPCSPVSTIVAMAAAQVRGVVETQVAQVDVRLHRREFDLEAQRYPERAVAVRKRVEEVGVVVGRRRREHFASAGQDVHLEHRFMRPAHSGTRTTRCPSR